MSQNFRQYFIREWGLTEENVDRLSSYQELEVEKGRVLVQPGKRSSSFYFVEKGMLRMYSLSEEGKEYVLHFAPENWIVGDRGSVYFDETPFFYIDAVEDSIVFRFSTSLMDQLTTMCSDFRRNNDRLLHNHIRHLNRRIALLQGANALERYLNFIELYPNVLLRVPQWMVASYLGITPESLSRVRKELVRENFTNRS